MLHHHHKKGQQKTALKDAFERRHSTANFLTNPTISEVVIAIGVAFGVAAMLGMGSRLTSFLVQMERLQMLLKKEAGNQGFSLMMLPASTFSTSKNKNKLTAKVSLADNFFNTGKTPAQLPYRNVHHLLYDMQHFY